MHHLLRRISCGAVFVLAVGAITTPINAQEPIEEIVERDPCAEYSWDAIPGVDSYNLVVMALPELEDPHPVIDVQLPPSATSWTPTLDGCLEADNNYFWSVRGVTPQDDADWLPSVVFRTVIGLPAEFVPEAPPAQSAEEAPSAQSSSGRTRLGIGTIRTIPKPGGLPSVGAQSIGETEKNDVMPGIRPVGPKLPNLSTRQLSDSAMEQLQRRRLQTVPPKIGYESEAEANAAAARRKREQEDAELARQQNELERQRREEAAAAAAREEQLPAVAIDAVMDLQTLKVQRHRESSGDEYYLVTYKLRGRRGADDRVHGFDYSKQVWPVVSGKNWAKKGREFKIPRGAGRLTFENLKPFEVYGFVAVLMEANKSKVEEREYAFGFGEFQNEEGVTETVGGAFERAVPRSAQLPDYSDTSKSNVQHIVNLNYAGIYRHFGDYRSLDKGLPAAIREVMYEPLKRSNRDNIDGVIWGFAMNKPGGHDPSPDQPVSAIFPPPNGPMIFRTQSTEVLGEHNQYER